MPIQNVGTLLGNLVVTEATLALLPLRHEQAPFEFLSSFAMPLSTPWVPHSQNVGFDPATLVRVRASKDSELPSDIGYPALLRTNLLSNNALGPNAALLVAGATLQSQIPCRMWLNDIREGHYLPEMLSGAIVSCKKSQCLCGCCDVSPVSLPRFAALRSMPERMALSSVAVISRRFSAVSPNGIAYVPSSSRFAQTLETVAIPVKYLDPVAPAVAEDEKMSGEGVPFH
jgi:hypothetical protein